MTFMVTPRPAVTVTVIDTGHLTTRSMTPRQPNRGTDRDAAAESPGRAWPDSAMMLNFSSTVSNPASAPLSSDSSVTGADELVRKGGCGLLSAPARL